MITKSEQAESCFCIKIIIIYYSKKVNVNIHVNMC